MNQAYLEVAVRLAREAGVVARAGFRPGRNTAWKSDNSPVTDADLAVNTLVLETLAAQFPDHGIIGEEESQLQDGAEYVWVCDPIDGTIPYAHGIPTSAFSLALTHHGAVIVAVVYDFHGDRMLTAVKGGGTFCNGAPIRTNGAGSLRPGVTDIEGLWVQGAAGSDNLYRLPLFLERDGSKLTKLSSTVYAGMLVALGELNGVITRGDKPWDLAALKLVVDEAGGRVTDLAGDEQRYDGPIRGALVSNGPLHATYLDLIAECDSV